MSGTQASDRPIDAEGALQRAYRDAIAFPIARINALAISTTQATDFAEQEASFGTVPIDEAGMSSGMRLNLLQPIHDVASAWRGFWNDFEIALEPKRRDIEAVATLDGEIAREIEKRDNALIGLEREIEQESRYVQVKDEFDNAQHVYHRIRAIHRGVDANMKAKHWFYWFSFIIVLATECFINYNAFTAFWNGVEVVALGTTVVLGILLAAASHGHGEIMKQWAYRFGQDRDPAMRRSDLRLFGISTSALAIVLTFTGWARYSLAAASLGTQSQPSALGDAGVVQVHPLQDVLISLVANLGAWMLGVIISYYAHDHDPDYMEATWQLWKRRRPYNQMRDSMLVKRKHVEARYAKEIENKTAEAETKRRAVSREADMLSQIRSRNDAVQRELDAVITRNVEVYRDALVRVALARQGHVQIVRTGSATPFSPFDYKAMKITPPSMSEVAA